MSMRMLIDARHPEETRVAVVKGSRIEEFDFESAEHKQLKGNIYLAKVTRVEPSLQAAFIDYGGNRHGFLAFSEIHPDYYQIPKADRDALLREEAEHAAEEERLRSAGYDDGDDHHYDEEAASEPDAGTAEGTSTEASGATDIESSDATEIGTDSNRSPVDESAADELRTKRQNLRRRYKIQDVIQRRQVLLVQVVKEERGNKGAALTTYLSLAGRYCVLMPNTSHGGGISRKIPNGADRKRLKSIMSDLSLPSTMGLIVRTAGLSRTKTEIKRDFDYLARLWDEIREKTLGSSAPALIYRDSDLIKRAIRDLYHREIDEVIVEGEDGYKSARGFMKLLMPSHVRRVKLHSESVPMFQRHGVEDQLSAMYQPLVQLKSGGYLVINPTEALVSIDINSGRSTREHNIEQTAFATNIEAAAEIARQLRLRDMAGLVVIDFIDMEQSSHVRKVERAMKDALRNDRARIQVGRISSFGLLEMSRQRLRTGVLEASTKPCAHCEGTGLMRTASSAGLSALRMIDDEAARGRGEKILLRAGRDAAIYVLNKKRSELAEIEQRYGVSIEIMIDETFEGARMAVDSSGPRPVAPVGLPQTSDRAIDEEDEDDFEAEELDEDEEAEIAEEAGDEDVVQISLEGAEARDGEEGGDDRSRRRRRRRRGGRGRGRRDQEGASDYSPEALTGDPVDEANDAEPVTAETAPAVDAVDGEVERPERAPRRRRSRRSEAPRAETIEPDSSPMVERPIDQPPITEMRPADDAEPAPKPRRGRRKAAAIEDVAKPAPLRETAETDPPAAEPVDSGDEPPAKPPARKRRTKAAAAKNGAAKDSTAKADPVAAAPPAKAPSPVSAANDDAGSANSGAAEASGADGDEARRGWWQRTFG